MTKKKILSIVLGVVICFNVCFSRPQRVEALAGVDDAAILIALYNALCGTVFLNNHSSSFSFSDNDFVDYYRITHENSEFYSYLIGQTAVANISGGICGGFLSKAFLKDFVQTANDFWSSYGNFTEEGYTYTPSSGTDVDLTTFKSNLIDFVNTYYPNQFNTDNIYNWVYINGTQRGAYPYVSFIRATGFKQANDDFIIFSCSSSDFLGAPPVYSSSGFKGSGSCVAGWRGGTSGNVGPWVFNGTYDFGTAFDSFTVISNYHISSSVSTDPVTVGLTPDGQDLASDPDDYAEKVSSGLAD